MKCKLPILMTATILWMGVCRGDAFAQQAVSSGKKSSKPPVLGDAFIKEAIARLEGYQSLSASISHEVNLFDKRLDGVGRYEEQTAGSRRLCRMELRLKLDEEISSLLQVCDGSYLWTCRNLGGETTVERQDVSFIAQEGGARGNAPYGALIGTKPGAGGLPKLLRGIRDSFDFSWPVRSGVLGEKKLPVWQIEGRLKPELLSLAATNKESQDAAKQGGSVDSRKLRQHVPDHVVIHLGQGSPLGAHHSGNPGLFPYKIEYRRSPSGSPLPGSGLSRSTTNPLLDQATLLESDALVVMKLFDVVVNRPIPVERFDYDPGNARLVEAEE